MSGSKAAGYWAAHPMIAQRRVEFLDAPMHLLSMEDTLALALEAMSGKVPLHHTVVNVAKLVTMQSDDELRQDVSEADLINIDGAGVVWGARLLGIPVPERVAGVDIMERLFMLCAQRGFRPYLLGAEAHVLDAVQQRLARELPSLRIAGAHDGYFRPEEEASIVEAINASEADCLFVAMPTPRKERFLRRHRDVLRASFIMGVGGSFDVYGGKVSRAPGFVQKMGLEWLFRLLQEPRRLWRRYYETNRRYAGLLWAAYRKKRAGAAP
ncbi:MAG TPA: WecB/TagA/CpsF family glycosyltransferase [Parvibaculum sp.]|uniref:WecB/TagA/CpsF family glycosyltransferase n=1 Tax=Parvibaculum sp. TaxID=2024848 RepID=UPI002C73C1AD|nr:WecB/TagA/CpsF family glycosyltransferase [Parvibaculum sp.]HMM15427.1 WecB/TagA/CpsF family glycosyltransferase [Parvibaculum sp.]